MRNFIAMAGVLLFFSCGEKQAASDFDERVLDLLIETRNGRWLELPDLYDKTVIGLPDQTTDRAVMAEKLELRGYKITAIKREVNGLSGERILAVWLSDGKCPCEVIKIYRPTSFVSQYTVSEKIRCE